jgi:3-phenylpropionate/trans-cinnamate dioxygenase ferredoxin reductase subunit
VNVVIVGAGHAGFQCAASLRQDGFRGEVVLIGDEPSLPYQRPPLSKAYLLGKASATDLLFRPPRFYEDHAIRRVQARVEQVERQTQRVLLQSGEAIAYDHLVLATGSRPRRLPVHGAQLDGVLSLQSLQDADALRQRVQPGRRAVVIGAGFIGLEFAAVARTLGMEVLVVDVADRALARAASAESAEVIVASHEQRGTRLRFSCGVAGIEGAHGKVVAVRTADAEALPADLVVVGIGVEPRTDLATQAGLQVDNGICVDAQLLTSDPHISAIGDAVSFPERNTGRRIRLESVQNATDQARVIAARLAGKAAKAYDAVPWFWSDQGDLKLQIAGLRSADGEHVVLCEPGARARTIVCIHGGRLAAVETIDRPADHMLARRLLAKGVQLSSAQAREPGFHLKALN